MDIKRFAYNEDIQRILDDFKGEFKVQKKLIKFAYKFPINDDDVIQINDRDRCKCGKHSNSRILNLIPFFVANGYHIVVFSRDKLRFGIYENYILLLNRYEKL